MNQRIEGTVSEYDSYLGTIVGADQNEYILKQSEIIESPEISVGDQVSFEPDCVEETEQQDKVARFVKVLQKSGKKVEQ